MDNLFGEDMFSSPKKTTSTGSKRPRTKSNLLDDDLFGGDLFDSFSSPKKQTPTKTESPKSTPKKKTNDLFDDLFSDFGSSPKKKSPSSPAKTPKKVQKTSSFFEDDDDFFSYTSKSKTSTASKTTTPQKPKNDKDSFGDLFSSFGATPKKEVQKPKEVKKVVQKEETKKEETIKVRKSSELPAKTKEVSQISQKPKPPQAQRKLTKVPPSTKTESTQVKPKEPVTPSEPIMKKTQSVVSPTPKSTPIVAKSPSVSDIANRFVSPAQSPKVTQLKKAPLTRQKSKTQLLLEWCQIAVADYDNVNLTNWTSSWWDGLGYCALIHHFFPNAIDYKSLSPENKQYNLKLAFDTAEKLGVCRFLDEEDYINIPPEQRSNITYVMEIKNTFAKKGRR